uniref:Uncharacterized protein n=1 Tax=Anguilla anguilla TaxID=7936 RepID=A0A0E9RVZ4_ANGAN
MSGQSERLFAPTVGVGRRTWVVLTNHPGA